MADRFLIPAGGVWADANSDIWAASSGGAADEGGLVADTDVAVLDSESGDLEIALGATVACVGMRMTGYTGQVVFNNSLLDINGRVVDFGGEGTIIQDGGGTIAIGGAGHLNHTFCDGAGFTDPGVLIIFDAVGGEDNPTLSPSTSDFPTLPALTIDNAVNSFIVGASSSGLRVGGDLTFTTGGKFDTTTNAVSTTHSGTSALAWNDETSRLYHYILGEGAVITLQARSWFSAFTRGASGTLTGFHEIMLVLEGDDKWVEGDAEISVSAVNFLADVAGATREIGAIALPDVTGEVRVGRQRYLRLVQTGDWLIGPTLRIQDYINGQHAQLDCKRSDLRVDGDIELGRPAVDKGGGFLLCGEGVMDWRGDVKIATDSNAGADDQNKIETESAYIALGGALDATGILLTGTGAAHVMGGTVQNTADKGVTGAIHCHGTTDGGNNDANVTFDEHASPGSLAAMGVGV